MIRLIISIMPCLSIAVATSGFARLSSILGVPIGSLVVAAVQVELSVDRLCYRRGSISVDSMVHIRNNQMD
jgi:hypothetical protein